LLVLVHVNITLYTKFEMPSFTHSQAMIKATKFKDGSCHPDHAS